MNSYACYAVEEIAAILLIGATAVRFGRRPTFRRAALAALGAVAMFAWVTLFTLVASAEGNDSRLLLLPLVGGWLVLAFVGRRDAAVGLGMLLTLATLGMRIQFLELAHSSRYTDNPHSRLMGVHYRQAHPRPFRRPEPPVVKIEPNGVTWPTGLYSVVPPTGGAAGR